MQPKLNFQQTMIAALMASAAAAVLNGILFFVFHAADVITDNIFVQPDQPLSIVPVLISSVVPTFIAAIVFFIIEKYSSYGYKIFSIISIVLLLLSLASPFMQIVGVTTGYAVVLCLMHIVVVVSLLYFLKSAKSSASQTK